MKTTIATLLIIFLAGCSKNNPVPAQDKLPGATTIGAKTAGCYINGQLLIAKDGINSISGFPVYGITTVVGPNFTEPIIGDDYFTITITNHKSKGKDYWISLSLNNMIKGTGNYIVGQSDDQSSTGIDNEAQIISRETNNGVSGKTFISSPNSGIITITRFDYEKGIFSGTFKATLYNKDNHNEIIQVTEGRFDD